jgi:hypothetical protein
MRPAQIEGMRQSPHRVDSFSIRPTKAFSQVVRLPAERADTRGDLPDSSCWTPCYSFRRGIKQRTELFRVCPAERTENRAQIANLPVFLPVLQGGGLSETGLAGVRPPPTIRPEFAARPDLRKTGVISVGYGRARKFVAGETYIAPAWSRLRRPCLCLQIPFSRSPEWSISGDRFALFGDGSSGTASVSRLLAGKAAGTSPRATKDFRRAVSVGDVDDG